jgi:hypothetical protein
MIDEGFIVYKHKGTNDKKKVELKIVAPKEYVYTYRCLGVTWVDVDEESNAVCCCDYSSVTGYDAKKFGDLITRALMRPSVADNTQKIIMLILVVIIILLIANSYFNYQNWKLLQNIPSTISNAITSAKGSVTPATGI